MMKTTHIVMVTLGGLTTLSLVGCEDKAAEAAGHQKPMAPLNVSVMPLQQRDVELTSTWFGHLRGVDQADIRPEVSGKLIKQVYQDGSLCQKGEVLFEIDPDTYRAAVAQAEANVAAAKASVLQAQSLDDRARQDVERYSKLVKSGSVAEKEFTDALQQKKSSAAALSAAEAQVKQAEAALETSRINLNRCTVRAPFTGLASKANASIGDLISANGNPLTTMSSIDPIRVDFAVPGKEMLNKTLADGYDAKTGTANNIPEFELILEDGSVFEHKGRVVSVDSEVSQSTGTINFVGHVPNGKLKLRSGSAVRVRATTGVLKEALLVPTRALVSSMNHRFIFVVAPDQTPCCIDVQLGESLPMEVQNGDGTKVTMLMQVVTGTVKPIMDSLKEIGIEEPSSAQVIVEGSQMAAIYAKANAAKKAAGAPAGYGTVIPRPFVYTHPVSTTPSVTAKAGASQNKGEAAK